MCAVYHIKVLLTMLRVQVTTVRLTTGLYSARKTTWACTAATWHPANYRSAIKDIHSSAVSSHLANRCQNRVLHRPAPAISPAERTLPRYYRTTLSQLRSGQCSRLNSYRHAIGISDTDLCPQCNMAPHTTDHVFDCPAAPTNLSVEDLWESPVEVARHLAALPAFAS